MNRDQNIVVSVDADTSKFDKAMDDITVSSQQFGRVFSSSLKQAAISGKSFEDTIRSIGMRLADLALNKALAPIENAIGNVLGNLVAGAGQTGTFAKGGAFNQNGAVPFAKGGVVANPTYFNFQGGQGLMGEAGAEAIMPLARGPDGVLGLATNAQSRPPTNVVFNVNAQDANSFRRSESQISAMLARAVARGNRSL